MTERQHPKMYGGEFCRVVIGSTIHGLAVKDTDDLDLMGVCLEDPYDALSMRKPFEQHVWRTQPEGSPSGPGDVDLTVYSLRKFLRLAAKGNPTLLNLLFVPDEYRHIDSKLADELRGLIPKIISKEAAARYLGYMTSQRERLMGERGQKHTGYTRRLKYQSEHGWDTKYAMHLCRLGCQGVELLMTGKITLPMRGIQRDMLMEVRRGEMELGDVYNWSLNLETALKELQKSSDLPEHPDWEYLNGWLVLWYLNYWQGGLLELKKPWGNYAG